MAVPSFPDVHVTGVVHHYIQINGGQLWFLGNAEVTPQMQVRRYTSKTMNDRAGRTLPQQKHWDGEAATVSVLLTYFSKFAEQELQQSGKAAGIQVQPGEESRWARGAAVYGNATFKLWQIYDNFFNPNGSSDGLEIGWFWPQVELLQRDTVKVGAQGEGLLLVFDCTPYLIPQASHASVNAQANERGWALFTQVSTDAWAGNPEGLAFPSGVQVPQ